MNKVINASYILIRLEEREFQKQLGNRFYQKGAKSKTKEKYINHYSAETAEGENNILLPSTELTSKAHLAGRRYGDPGISQLLTLNLTGFCRAAVYTCLSQMPLLHIKIPRAQRKTKQRFQSNGTSSG